MSNLRRKSTAKPFPGSKGPGTKYRDRDTVTAPDGTRKDVQGYGPTKDKATADFVAKAQAFIAAHPSVTTMTYKQLSERWLEHKRVQGRKRRTISSYDDVLRNHLLPALGEIPVSRITLEDMQRLQYGLVKTGKYRTAEMAVLILKASYDFAAKLYRGQIDIPNLARDLDTVTRPRTVDPMDAIWTPEQIDRFLSLSKKEYDDLRSLYYPLYLTSISAGLRRGELLGLRWENVGRTPHGPYIRVREQYVPDNGVLYLETPKTGASDRELPITEDLYLILMAHRELLLDLERRLPDYAPNDLVFPGLTGQVISPSNLRRGYNALIRRAKLPPIYFHSLRKCAATYITQALVDAGKYAPKIVAQILGHARSDVALEIYTKVINDDLRFATFTPSVTGRLPECDKAKK